jgi:hypothetical protein
MKILLAVGAMVSGVLFALSTAMANPALLPKHPGYPMKNDGSPVNGQPTANDPGQHDGHGDAAILQSSESIKHAEQKLMDQNNNRIVKKEGAGQLPQVQGPQIKVEPPVTSATKADASLGAK